MSLVKVLNLDKAVYAKKLTESLNFKSKTLNPKPSKIFPETPEFSFLEIM
jgi:hypothetical protein